MTSLTNQMYGPCMNARRQGLTRAETKCFGPGKARCVNLFTGRSAVQGSTMILPQVHLRKPCYDFSFL
ncbi:hypothetical protein Hdeb2414_s1297g01006341 [Helianthus debilis subsp. tardiflorus]